MISATVSVRHFHGRCAESQPQYLMPKADSKDGYSLTRDPFHRLWRILHCGWVARTVRQKYSVRLELENFLGGCGRRNDRHPTIVLGEETQDVALDAVIVRG